MKGVNGEERGEMEIVSGKGVGGRKEGEIEREGGGM